MALVKMDYELAMAAALDAANRNMRREGRTRWNLLDWQLAVDEFNRLLPEENESGANPNPRL